MSAEQVQQFFSKVKADEALQQQFESVQGNNPGSFDAIVKLAADNGFAFTADDLTGSLRQLSIAAASESGELSDEQLESIAGGGCPYCISTDGSYCMCTGKFTESWF